jgi:hypothetical protein
LADNCLSEVIHHVEFLSEVEKNMKHHQRIVIGMLDRFGYQRKRIYFNGYDISSGCKVWRPVSTVDLQKKNG